MYVCSRGRRRKRENAARTYAKERGKEGMGKEQGKRKKATNEQQMWT